MLRRSAGGSAGGGSGGGNDGGGNEMHVTEASGWGLVWMESGFGSGLRWWW